MSGQLGGVAISWCVSLYVAQQKVATSPGLMPFTLDSCDPLQQTTANLNDGGRRHDNRLIHESPLGIASFSWSLCFYKQKARENEIVILN